MSRLIPQNTTNKNLCLILAVTTLCLSVLLISCDCWNCGKGIVVDSITLKPVDNVTVKSYIDNVSDKTLHTEMVTDSTGKFEGTTGNTGFCHDLVIELSKTGYKTTTVRNPVDVTVKLVKE